MRIEANNTLDLVGRILLASLFITSGIAKVSAPEATLGYIESIGMPYPLLSLLAALAVELGLATALVVGLKTRQSALAMAGFSVATAVLFHNQLGDTNQQIHFLKNLAIAGGLLQVARIGAGAFSLDAVLNRRRRIQSAVA